MPRCSGKWALFPLTAPSARARVRHLGVFINVRGRCCIFSPHAAFGLSVFPPSSCSRTSTLLFVPASCLFGSQWGNLLEKHPCRSAAVSSRLTLVIWDYAGYFQIYLPPLAPTSLSGFLPGTMMKKFSETSPSSVPLIIHQFLWGGGVWIFVFHKTQRKQTTLWCKCRIPFYGCKGAKKKKKVLQINSMQFSFLYRQDGTLERTTLKLMVELAILHPPSKWLGFRLPAKKDDAHLLEARMEEGWWKRWKKKSKSNDLIRKKKKMFTIAWHVFFSLWENGQTRK